MAGAHANFQLSKGDYSHLLLTQAFTILLFFNELTSWMLSLIALSILWQVAQLAKSRGNLALSINTAETNESSSQVSSYASNLFAFTRETAGAGVGRKKRLPLISRLKPTPKLVVMLFALTGAGIIIANGRSLGLLLSMVHLICFAYGIKSLEIKTRKDFYQLILIGLFLQACALIFIQSLWFTMLVVAAAVLNFGLLYRYFSASAEWKLPIMRSAKLLAYSVPLAAALFVFFPRLSPFWQVPLAEKAKTGLSDEVSPGDIANLARSDELAFRVEFFSNAPSKGQMYWRAMTLPYFDGQSWKRSPEGRTASYLNLPADISRAAGQSYQYQVMLEPSNQRWLYSLDTPFVEYNEASSSLKISRLYDYSLINDRPINATKSYQVTSFSSAVRGENMPRSFKHFFTNIPEDNNPRLTELGIELSQTYANKRDIINQTLIHFREQAYFYTLQPPLLNKNGRSLDQFYFDTRSGFCEHYASSFAFLMRAAGIPARVITGYLGGEYNQQGNYYSIYQYDAHAWTEVWLEGEGWVAIDPTAAVSPDRVSDSMSDALRQQRVNLAGSFSWQAFSSAAWMLKIRMQIEAIDYQWNRFILSYTMDKQDELLRQLLGDGRLWKAALIIALTFLSMIGLLWLRNQWLSRERVSTVWQKQFMRVLKQLNLQGYTRELWQSPHKLVAPLNKAKMGLGSQYEELYKLYQQLSYQPMAERQRDKLARKFQKSSQGFIKELKQAR